MNQFVTVATFSYPHEIGIPCSLLELEGIEFFVRDEIATIYVPVVGSIKIQVRDTDEAKAKEILKEGGFID